MHSSFDEEKTKQDNERPRSRVEHTANGLEAVLQSFSP